MKNKVVRLGVSLDRTSGQDNYETVELLDNLNNYSVIQVVTADALEVNSYACYSVPVGFLKNITTGYCSVIGTYYESRIRYIDDTHIGIRQMRLSTSSNASCHAIIYGIR